MIDNDKKYVWHPFTQMMTEPDVLEIVKAEGIDRNNEPALDNLRYKFGNLKSKQIERPNFPQGRLKDLTLFPAEKVFDSKYFSFLLNTTSYI